MTSARLAHSDESGCALVRKAHAHEHEVRIAPIDVAAEHLLEPLCAQRFERALALLTLEPLLRCAAEPARRFVAVVRLDRDEERVHRIFRTGFRPPLASEREGGQQPDRAAKPQVPEQEGANSSSSAAETNSSLHQNEASE